MDREPEGTDFPPDLSILLNLEAVMVDRFIVVDTVAGRLEADLVKSFLHARGIQCELSQESVGTIYGISVGSLGVVEILVPSRQGKKARQALKEYHRSG
jgi:hypothetical protein